MPLHCHFAMPCYALTVVKFEKVVIIYLNMPKPKPNLASPSPRPRWPGINTTVPSEPVYHGVPGITTRTAELCCCVVEKECSFKQYI